MANIVLNKDNFKEIIEDNKERVLVDFFAPWCVYCRRLNPVMDQLERELAGKVKIARVDIDEQPELADKFEIDTIPSLIFFKDGEASEQLVNPDSRVQIVNLIEGK